MDYYCVREGELPESSEARPCPDADKCHMCGKYNTLQIPVKVMLTHAQIATIIDALDEVADEKQDVLENGPYMDEDEIEDEESLIADMRAISDLLQKVLL